MKKIVILEPKVYSNVDETKKPLLISSICQVESDQLDKLTETYKVFDFKTGKELTPKSKIDDDE